MTSAATSACEILSFKLMPYIQSDKRPRYDKTVQTLVEKLTETFPNGEQTLDVGHLNYVISSIVWKLFKQSPSYRRANDLLGVLEAVKLEFVRRQVNPYEDRKIAENGDLVGIE